MPRVSILLPFRQAAGTLNEAVDSIAGQTYTDWELLLIDNGGDDDGASIARAWAGRDRRIRVIAEPTAGIAHALNTGLRHASGPLVARMDADDTSHTERLARQVACMDANPDIGVLGTATHFTSTVPEHRGMAAFVAWQNALVTPEDHAVKRFVDAPLAHPTVLFRHELVDRHGSYDTGPVPEDHELWLRWMDNGVRFAKLPEPLLTWNDHAGRLSRTHPHYSTEAFTSTKVKWLARWLHRHLCGRPLIVAGTSTRCRARADLLAAAGIPVHGYTDVRQRSVPEELFIPAAALPAPGKAFIVSFIGQRGAGDRIATFMRERGLLEGRDLLLAA